MCPVEDVCAKTMKIRCRSLVFSERISCQPTVIEADILFRSPAAPFAISSDFNTVVYSALRILQKNVYRCSGRYNINKMLSYRRATELQGTLVLAESGRLELGDNILRTLYNLEVARL